MPYAQLKGMRRLKAQGAGVVAAKAVIARTIGVLSGGPDWILGSLLGSYEYAGWIYFMLKELEARYDHLVTLTPENRMATVKNIIQELGRRWAELDPETKKRYAEEALRNIDELRARLQRVLAIAKDILAMVPVAATK